MPFVDYRNDDGFFRKYRVMFVDGKPYACHLAISPRWMIHYYNAAMADHEWMREEEARFIANLDAVFTGRLRDALDEISAAIPLEYFGIDCAIARDDRLLLFEADAAMLVHGTDPPDLYPYKRAGFKRIKSALLMADCSLVAAEFVFAQIARCAAEHAGGGFSGATGGTLELGTFFRIVQVLVDGRDALPDLRLRFGLFQLRHRSIGRDRADAADGHDDRAAEKPHYGSVSGRYRRRCGRAASSPNRVFLFSSYSW